MDFKLGQLVTVWVDDLDPIVKRRYKDKFGLIKEITYTEQSNRDGRPSFIKVFFPEINRETDFVIDRIRLVEDNNA